MDSAHPPTQLDVTGVINSLNVLVDEMPRHIRELHSNASESMSDSESFIPIAKMSTMSNTHSHRSDADAFGDTSADESSKEEVEVILL